jgi:antitoxin YefM
MAPAHWHCSPEAGTVDQRPPQTIIMVMSKVFSLSEVKAKFSEIVDEVSTTHERVMVTRNGRPVVVVVSADDLEAIEETLSILSDPVAMQAIGDGRAAIAAGDYSTREEIEALRDRLRARSA